MTTLTWQTRRAFVKLRWPVSLRSRERRRSGSVKTYPAYPIKIIVPFAAGGGVDAFARLLAKQIEEKHGKSIVIENRAGANGTVGASGVLQSQPDGYMLLFSAATHVMARQVMSKVPSIRSPTSPRSRASAKRRCWWSCLRRNHRSRSAR